MLSRFSIYHHLINLQALLTVEVSNKFSSSCIYNPGKGRLEKKKSFDNICAAQLMPLSPSPDIPTCNLSWWAEKTLLMFKCIKYNVKNTVPLP